MLLARSGTKVLVVDRELSLAQRTVAMILAEGGDAAAHATDVTSESECNDMVTAALDHFGRLDYLDNNVGIGSRGSVVDEPAETWRRVMQVKVATMFLTSKFAIPAIRRTGGGVTLYGSSFSSCLSRRTTSATTIPSTCPAGQWWV